MMNKFEMWETSRIRKRSQWENKLYEKMEMCWTLTRQGKVPKSRWLRQKRHVVMEHGLHPQYMFIHGDNFQPFET